MKQVARSDQELAISSYILKVWYLNIREILPYVSCLVFHPVSDVARVFDKQLG
jgi:hypothetical protein